jgi:DNA-directed RNA polymerase alpha subunit
MMFDPIPNLSDETLIETVRFPTILRNALISAGLKTIGEIRASPDNELGRITRIGKESLTYLRRTLGRADRRHRLD